MKTFKKIAVLLVTLIVLCSGLPVALSQEDAPGVDARDSDSRGRGNDLPKQVVTKVISPREQKAALAFWTREAVAAAMPMELPSDSGPAMIDTAAAAGEATGAYGFVPSGRATSDADAVAQAAYALDWAAPELELLQAEAAALAPDGTSQTHTSYTVNELSSLQKVYPHRWIGRLSFKISGSTNYCSATAISGNVILTAAHCLYDTTSNVWYSNWVFQPAYRAGNVPYGSFAAKQCWVLTAYINEPGYSINGAAKYDVGVCKMNNNSAGQTLNGAVGYAGREWNYGDIRHVHNLGYPWKDYNNSALASAGAYLRTCVAETFYQTTETRGMGCFYGGGISGGPWLTGYAVNVATGNVTGVNSGIFVGTQNIYGARFTSNNIVPLCTSAGC